MTVELRWKIEDWEEYHDGLPTGVTHRGEPVLQFCGRYDDGSWSEWQDVPTVHYGP